MEILIKAGQLLLALSILVTLHELGHYWAARLFKIRVEKFYLFFDFLFPLPSVMKFSIFKKKIKDTEWGIGWFPMGGYVQIAGMMDESMDKETLAQEPKPDEFRSKPAWQRLIVMLGGVLVNFFLGIFIYCMIMWIWGEKYLPNSSLKHGLYADTLAQSIGLRNGDMILKADNDTLVNYLDIVPTIGINQAKTLLVKRGDSTFTLPIPAGFHGKLTASQGEGFIDFRREFIVLDINGGAATAAAKAGMKKGDHVIAINGQSAQYYDEVRNFLNTHKNQSAQFTVSRKDGSQAVLKVDIPENGKLGVALDIMDQFELKTRNYGFFGAIPAGTSKAFTTLGNYVKGLNLLIKGLFGKSEVKASDSVGGFISIGNLFPSVWNWELFWNMTAVLSLILAVMNLLPIPALDGGHVIFNLWEIITRRKPSDKVLEYAQYVGMILLLALMVYVNANDIYKFVIVKWLH